MVRNNQRVFQGIVDDYLQQIEFGSDDWAKLIHLPQYRTADVVVDPGRSFGIPIFANGGALLSASLVHLNTALVETVLSEPDWTARMTVTDRRALSPVFWTHISLYGKFDLDMSTLLDLASVAAPHARVP